MLPSTRNWVITDRGGIEENRHIVHAAIVDAKGNLLGALGDPSRLTLARSAAKPAQALAILETGAFREFGFDDSDLALMCSSHSSEEMHISQAKAMLDKINAQEEDLCCGGHPAMSELVNKAWIQKCFNPGPLCNNCSGKHVGMLAGAKTLNAGAKDYHTLDSPMQQRVKETFQELCEPRSEQVKWAIDGCNLPAPACPLDALAQIYALFADAADDAKDKLSGTPQRTPQMAPQRSFQMARVFNAMTAHPERVAGEDRFCTALMRAYQGSLIAKVGADGCYGIGVRGSELRGPLAGAGSIGIAVKIDDGSEEILYAVVAKLLDVLEIGNVSERKILAPFYSVSRLNTAGQPIGGITFAFSS